MVKLLFSVHLRLKVNFYNFYPPIRRPNVKKKHISQLEPARVLFISLENGEWGSPEDAAGQRGDGVGVISLHWNRLEGRALQAPLRSRRGSVQTGCVSRCEALAFGWRTRAGSLGRMDGGWQVLTLGGLAGGRGSTGGQRHARDVCGQACPQHLRGRVRRSCDPCRQGAPAAHRAGALLLPR